MKVHRIISVTPIVSGFDRQALCGAAIRMAEAIPLTEFVFVPDQTTKIFCKECFGPHLHYAVCDGQEAHDRERLSE